MVVCLEAANAVLPFPLCADPMVPLVATLAVFKAMPESDSVALKDKEQVSKVGNYLAKCLATVATLVDKSMPTLVALYDTIPCGERGRQRGPRNIIIPSYLILAACFTTESHLPSWTGTSTHTL